MHCVPGISQQQSFPLRERTVLLPQSLRGSNELCCLPQWELNQLLHSTPSSEGGMILRKTFHPISKQCFTAPAPWQTQSHSSQIVFPTRPPPTMATLFPRGSLGSIAGAAPRSQLLPAVSPVPVLLRCPHRWGGEGEGRERLSHARVLFPWFILNFNSQPRDCGQPH